MVTFQDGKGSKRPSLAFFNILISNLEEQEQTHASAFALPSNSRRVSKKKEKAEKKVSNELWYRNT